MTTVEDSLLSAEPLVGLKRVQGPSPYSLRHLSAEPLVGLKQAIHRAYRR